MYLWCLIYMKHVFVVSALYETCICGVYLYMKHHETCICGVYLDILGVAFSVEFVTGDLPRLNILFYLKSVTRI